MLISDSKMRECVVCSNPFLSTSHKAVTCSKKCSNQNYRNQQKAKKPIEVKPIELIFDNPKELDKPIHQENTTHQDKPIHQENTIELKINDKLLNIKEVCIMLDCSDRFIYELVKKGLLKSIKISERKTRFNINDINNYLKTVNK